MTTQTMPVRRDRCQSITSEIRATLMRATRLWASVQARNVDMARRVCCGHDGRDGVMRVRDAMLIRHRVHRAVRLAVGGWRFEAEALAAWKAATKKGWTSPEGH